MADTGRCSKCGEYRYWCRTLGCTTGPVDPPWVHDCGGHPRCGWCHQVPPADVGFWICDDVRLVRGDEEGAG